MAEETNDTVARECGNTIADLTRCSFVRKNTIAEGKWIQLFEVTYQDATGEERAWEYVSRTAHPKDSAADCVGIIAVHKRLLHYDNMILVKQYRPALKACTIEFPAGYITDGETPEAAALRKLQQETGYVGKVRHVGPLISLDPGMSNCTMRLVSVEIDGDTPENMNIKKGHSTDGEHTEVMLVPVLELLQRLHDYAAAGFVIDSRVHSYAVGLLKGNEKRKDAKKVRGLEK